MCLSAGIAKSQMVFCCRFPSRGGSLRVATRCSMRSGCGNAIPDSAYLWRKERFKKMLVVLSHFYRTLYEVLVKQLHHFFATTSRGSLIPSSSPSYDLCFSPPTLLKNLPTHRKFEFDDEQYVSWRSSRLGHSNGWQRHDATSLDLLIHDLPMYLHHLSHGRPRGKSEASQILVDAHCHLHARNGHASCTEAIH